MPASRKPRKAYRPGRIDTDPVETAIALASKLLPTQRAVLRQPLRAALQLLRTGSPTAAPWNDRADGMNVAEQLARRGIASDRMPEILAAQAALHAVHTRHAERGTWTLRGPELQALRVGRFFHFVQLNYCTQGELRDAITTVQRNVAQALKGNASPRARICVGALNKPTATPAAHI